MTFSVPRSPDGSWFQIDYDHQGHPRLSWSEPFRWTVYLFLAAIAFGSVIFFGWFLQHIPIQAFKQWQAIFKQGLPGGSPVAAVAGLVALGLMTAATVAGALAMCWMIYAALRLPRADRLTFGPRVLQYVTEAPSRLRMNVWEVPRADLGQIRLDEVTEYRGLPPRQRLTIDYGAERIEIGKQLREPDREWLAQILRDWSESEQPERLPVVKVPANSSIRVEGGEQGWLRLRWKPLPPQPAARWTGVAHLSVWLLLWALIEIVVAIQIVAG